MTAATPPWASGLPRRIRACLLLAGLSGACSSAPPPAPAPPPQKECPPPTLEVVLSASARVNPSPDGEGRPVQVRAYQLASDARLRNSTFEDIWQKDKETLQTDLVAVEQYSLFPNETKNVVVKPNAQAHFLALVALFREPQGKDWFTSFELADPGAQAECPKTPPRLPVWLDRMQIQDGQGRAEAADAAAPSSGEK